MNEVLKTINKRRSTRKFKNEQISEEELNQIIKAGLYAPSCHNQQSWHFTIVQNKELLNELNDATKKIGQQVQNEMIQKLMSNKNFRIFYNAPTTIIISGRNDSTMPQVDCAVSTQNMLIAAESMNIGSCSRQYNRLQGCSKMDLYQC